VASDALEPNPPNRFTSAVIARDILVFDVLVDVVGQLKELCFVLKSDALLAEIIVGF
jgi:hypothetical protein